MCALWDCSHWPQKKKVEESLVNRVRDFLTYQAILAEHFNDTGAQLACYQNRIVGDEYDEYGGTAWKDYDIEFRRVEAHPPKLLGPVDSSIAVHSAVRPPESKCLKTFRDKGNKKQE
ncbi:hypothetical protein NDU88_008471 [Pleurodeles waltl]|uniref:Uncharacterized protein n=1 Tax=Pleurodeles waltl TaxID=8319 RepID=A0AAV7NWC0_PLEWA|nr:hypothetical protein NDU88_008471 [Pleurodeles waltl]